MRDLSIVKYPGGNEMQRKKAVEIVGYSRMRAKAIGIMIWAVLLPVGVMGWILWKWYFLPIAILIGFVIGSIYSIFETKRIERLTGLNVNEQEKAYADSLVAKLDPITKNPKKYREYIDSIPDEEENTDSEI
jgi:hypothetical protein